MQYDFGITSYNATSICSALRNTLTTNVRSLMMAGSVTSEIQGSVTEVFIEAEYQMAQKRMQRMEDTISTKNHFFNIMLKIGKATVWTLRLVSADKPSSLR